MSRSAVIRIGNSISILPIVNDSKIRELADSGELIGIITDLGDNMELRGGDEESIIIDYLNGEVEKYYYSNIVNRIRPTTLRSIHKSWLPGSSIPPVRNGTSIIIGTTIKS